MKKFVIVFSWILVILWMGLIFYLSDMNGDDSTYKSGKTINTAIKVAVNATNTVGITSTSPNSTKVDRTSELLQYPLRKLMHFSMYFVLSLLLVNALYRSGVKGKKIFYIALLVSALYACTDEFHQLFSNRTASFIDVIIDTSGSLVAVILINIFIRFRRKKES